MARRGISPYPDMQDERTSLDEKGIGTDELKHMLTDLRKAFGDLGNLLEDKTHRVDEYRVQTIASDSNTGVLLQPEYEVSEIIESVIVTGPVNSGPSVTSEGSTGVAPAQNATVASISAALLQSVAPIGASFDVAWTAELSGTLTAADRNNMYLSSPLGTLRQQGVISETNPAPQPQQGLQRFVPGAAGINVQVGTTGAGSAAAIYTAAITATVDSLVEAPFQLKLGKRVWNLLLPTSGILVIAPVRFSMGRNDDRLLTSNVPGDWGLELMGFANFTESYRTLA